MPLNARIVFALGCVSLIAIAAPAFANPQQRDTAPDHRKLAAKPAHPIKPTQAARVARNAKPTHPVRSVKRGAQHAAAMRDEDRLVSQPVQISASARKPMFGWPRLVVEARKYLGTNPTGAKRLWCARFMNFVLAKVGYAGTGSDAAKSFAAYGHRISGPEIGAIAVLTRGRRGGHVGVVTGIDPHGNPIILSGNHGRSVGEGVYSRSRVIAYVMPSDSRITPSSPAAVQTASARPSEHELDSPIAELIAAIDAESTHAETQQPQVLHATAQQPQVPHLTVQQMAQVQASAPAVQNRPVAARRDVPLDPALAEFLGLKKPGETRPAPARAQHSQHTQSAAGQFASHSISDRRN